MISKTKMFPKSAINSFMLAPLLAEAIRTGTYREVEVESDTLKYIIEPRIGKHLGMSGYWSNVMHGDPPNGLEISEALVKSPYLEIPIPGVEVRAILNIHGVSDGVPERLIPVVLTHERTETLTGNHFYAVISEFETATRLGLLDAHHELAPVRDFGLTIRDLHAALVCELDFRKLLKIGAVLSNLVGFLDFLVVCGDPRADEDLRIFGQKTSISKEELLSRGYSE